MTTNYNPDQKRGGPANAGNWTKYENSGPEGVLTEAAVPAPLVSDADLVAADAFFAVDLAAITAAQRRSEKSALVALNARALHAMPTAQYVVCHYDFANKHLAVSSVLDVGGNNVQNDDHGMNACVEIFDTSDLSTRGDHGFDYDELDDSFTFTLDRSPKHASAFDRERANVERRTLDRQEFDADKADLAAAIQERFPDANEAEIYNSGEEEGGSSYAVSEIRHGTVVLWNLESDKALRTAPGQYTPFEDDMDNRPVSLDRYGMRELEQPADPATRRKAWTGITF